MKTQTQTSTEQAGEEATARANFARYQYGLETGHRDYIDVAGLNEDMYLGGGLQWRESDRLKRNADKRPMIELNHILPAVNTATGQQLHSRVDMNFLPRGEGADEASATLMTKLVTQVCDDLNYQWSESQAYEDGLIQQRGYLEFRVNFDGNIYGEIELDVPDPLDVIPDPDARSYDPKDWNDLIITRWYTIDEVEQHYGKDKVRRVEQLADAYISGEESFLSRPHFNEDSDGGAFHSWVTQDADNKQTRLYLIIDRQHRKYTRGKVFVSFAGDVTPMELLGEEEIERLSGEGVPTVMNYSRIQWTVTCGSVVLHDSLSPYRTYTIVPYFPYFRRGRTRGMVDNLRSPQELENKSMTNFLEILGTTSNSGWDVPDGSLVNREPEDLEKHGADPGLVNVYRVVDGQKPERRQPLTVPVGAERLAERAELAIKTISGMSDALQGLNSNEVSGKAIQSKQYQGQTQLGRPLDNLAFTRRLAASKIVELIQGFYTNERVIRIVDRDTGSTREELVINQATIDGVLNDVTIGKYDVVITDTPTHATFQESQFDQVMSMKKEGVAIPDRHIIAASSYSKKHQLIKELEEAADTPDPLQDAEVKEKEASADLKTAQAEKARADAVEKRIESKYEAVQTAGVISANPATAPLADVLLRSSGDEDLDKPPLLPEYPGDAREVYRETGERPVVFPAGNTSPALPAPPPEPQLPGVGAQQGIETQKID